MSAQVAASASPHYRACNLCEAICGIEIRVEEGRVVSIRGDAEDPFSRGHICPKAVALGDIQSDPDRLRRPLERSGDGWREIGWDEAFDKAAAGIRRVQERYGRDAVATYLGNPTVHNYGAMLFAPRLLKALKTRNKFSATSVDQLPHHWAALKSFGHALLLPVPDLDRTDFLLVLGANPVVSNGSLMTAPGVRKRLEAIRERGGAVEVVDPRRTETARLADRHFFVRPGSDAWLLSALLATIFEEGLESPGRLAGFSDHVDRLRAAVAPFAPERVAAAVGIEAPEIRALARRFAAARSAVCHARLGVSVHSFGTLCQTLVNALHVVTGNLDRPGGALFTRPAVDAVAVSRGGSIGRWKSRVRGLPEFGGELPAATLAEEIEAEGEGRIRALLTHAGNPVLSTPNGRRLERGLESLDFMVSIDLYLNETTRHADLILPPTAPLEHDHYDLAFNLLAVRNVARYSPPLFEPEPDSRHDWQIFAELERRLGRRGARAAIERSVMRRLGPRGLLALGLRHGPSKLTLKKLERAVHGVDLGPLEPCLPKRLRTEGKRIDVLPDELAAELERLEAELPESAAEGNGSLLLIGRRQVRSCNSWMHNYERLMRGRDRCTLLMHPDDAERLGFGVDPDARPLAAVSSRAGSLEVPVEVTASIMPGVVSLPHGWGHHRPGTRTRVAGRSPGASLNDLTDETRVDAVSGNAVLNGVPVQVRPV